MSDTARVDAVAADLAALQAVVRALADVQAGRSRTALCDLLQALQTQAERLAVDEDPAAQAVVEAWIDDFRERAIAA